MRVFIKGSAAPIDLTQQHYIAQGGQGTMYARRGIGYKVYHNSKDMLPLGKIQELQAITDPRVVRPQDVLVDKYGAPIGYTTKFVDDAYVLTQLFPKVFRERNGLDLDAMKGLVRKLKESIDNIHAAQVLVVDCNEMNFLVDKGFNDIFCIDTDSYQTPHYPATAIMDSIRDWTIKNNDWNELSDWYSFGILAFQMFCGIHPYKGRYKGAKPEFKAKLPTDDPNDAFAVTRRRMLGCISVMHKDVGVPDAAYPVDTVPKGYRAWFEALFVQGKRCAPPADFGTTVLQTAQMVAVNATAKLDIAEIGDFQGTVTGVWSDGQHLVVATDQGVYLDGQRVTTNPKVLSGIGFTPKGGRSIMVDGGKDVPVLTNLTDRTQIPFLMKAREVATYDGRVYVRTEDRIYEIVLTDAGAQIIASSKEVAQTLPHATRLFPGVAIQKFLGSTFVSLFTRPGAAYQVQIKDLDRYRIIDAEFDHGVLMIIGEHKGQYDRIVIRFDDAGIPDQPRIVQDITPTGLNFTVLDSGVCVCLNEDTKLELFSNKPGSTGLKLIEDPVLRSDMLLFRQAGTVLFARGSKVYKMKAR